ncbi:hypothetical protein K435DRAFT_791788 [Dendrothele bispora CBS 962.96]|uniref:FAD/NAD(P)-binding domain-containing protein n=1 Tax=Dendrothele bispora (strain CBS 962.96) TaxID=1314807 RepID=A0A4S8MMG5_DENBC|nr:hypothetical protein K435DRAFT_791788 [Dendrothele bispora CBS 962.96]
MSPLSNKQVDESSKVHSQAVIIRSQPAIYLAQANLNSVLFEGFMGNGFAAGGQRTATVNVKKFPGFPTRIFGPDEFRKRSLRFGQEDEEPETADTLIVATGATSSVKRLELKGEEAYWQSRISACAVRDGAIPIFRNKPLAVIGGCDSVAEEATCSVPDGSHSFSHPAHICSVGCVAISNPSPHSSSTLLPLTLLPTTTILWDTVAIQCQCDGELLKNPRIRNAETGSEKDLAVNGLLYAIDKAITSTGNGCMAALEAERLIAEKELMGESRESGGKGD